MRAKKGTYLVEFNDGKRYVFGNNYKPWWQHAVEFIYYNRGDRDKIAEQGWRYHLVAEEVKSVQYSNQPFYDDGGLKWCNIDAYQEVITNVCKRDEIAPVDARLIVFHEAPQEKSVLTKKLKEY